MEQIKTFFEAMEKNEVLKQKVFNLAKEEKISEVVAVAAGEGFTFTENDWKECMKPEITKGGAGKANVVSEKELESVAGGTSEGDGWSIPWQSKECWFIKRIDRAPKPNGDLPCGRVLCEKICFGENGFGLYCCYCYNSSVYMGPCVKKWHPPLASSRCRQ